MSLFGARAKGGPLSIITSFSSQWGFIVSQQHNSHSLFLGRTSGRPRIKGGASSRQASLGLSVSVRLTSGGFAKCVVSRVAWARQLGLLARLCPQRRLSLLLSILTCSLPLSLRQTGLALNNRQRQKSVASAVLAPATLQKHSRFPVRIACRLAESDWEALKAATAKSAPKGPPGCVIC